MRVRSARVEVADEVVGAIERGLLVYVGFARGDTPEDRAWVLSKMIGLRVFDDGAAGASAEKKKMTMSVAEIGGAVLLVSQFTLYGDLRRGRRPSFDAAMPAEEARAAYDATVHEARLFGVPVESGRFQAQMQVHSVNDGPVTLWLDSAARGAPRVG